MDKLRIGMAGAGSVAGCYLERLRTVPYVEVVAICDIVPERARQRADEFNVPQSFGSVEEMLANAEFDLFHNVTSIPAHFEVNLQAIEAGCNVYSEKPFAPTYEQGKDLLDRARARGRRFWAAPTTTLSPQFRCIAEFIERGELGRAFAAHGCYGHGGPSWGPWFYRKGGGCTFDLAVYNVTTLTGLLGPAKAVTALMATCIPERTAEGERVQAEAEDNVMILMDHGNGVLSHVQTGFVYGAHSFDHTVDVIGTEGAANLMGWDWGPTGVQLSKDGGRTWEVHCTDADGYTWENGVEHIAQSLLAGREPRLDPEHALHVVEVMDAAHRSAATGNRVPITSTFAPPYRRS